MSCISAGTQKENNKQDTMHSVVVNLVVAIIIAVTMMLIVPLQWVRKRDPEHQPRQMFSKTAGAPPQHIMNVCSSEQPNPGGLAVKKGGQRPLAASLFAQCTSQDSPSRQNTREASTKQTS